jgi:maleate isomerase
LPEGVALHTTRLKLVGSSREELLAMTEKVEEGSALLADAGVDLIVFHCTAVSTFDPTMEKSLIDRIEKATKKPATTTSEGLVSAFRTLKANKVVLLTPYIEEINRREVNFLKYHDISVLKEAGMNISDGSKMGLVEPGDWYRFVMSHRDSGADAYFLSCTAIRTAPVIAALERDLGKPVVTSNQAMAWHCLRKLGVYDPVPGFGALFLRS